VISTGHHKHAKLARPALGHYGRNEWALVGTSCGQIQQLARQIIAAFSDRYRCAYLDADHAGADAAPELPVMLAAGAQMAYTDMIDHHQFRVQGSLGSHQFRQLFQEADLIVVNGNHHPAARQVVIIDPAKENSLRKRLAQLTDVALILLPDGVEKAFDFLENSLPEAAGIPRLHMRNTAGLLDFFAKEMQVKTPLLHGLVLAGGQSRRMGRDKGLIEWHGKPQREYMADLLQPLCTEVYISSRPGQTLESNYPILPDTFTELGPYGALLSAFRRFPDHAWLVTACDLPLLDQATLHFLVQNRQPKRIATSFRSPSDQLPEPLMSIWEPKSYAVLLAFLAQGYSCPRKVLINSDVHIVKATDPAALTNVNTPEEMQALALKLQRSDLDF